MTNSETPEPLEVCWRVFEASSARILTCAMFDASRPGVELRVGHFGDSPLRSQIMPDLESARVLAKDWLDAVRAAAAARTTDLSYADDIPVPRLHPTD
jgi:hypothetical protein